MRKIPKNRATATAIQSLKKCGIFGNPLELPIEDIALALGVMNVQAINIDGAQGRILIEDDEAIISYNNNIHNESKRRFVIAHELGHFLLHKDIFSKIAHIDDEKTLSEWYAKGVHEKEANQFAAELLMPSELYMRQVRGKMFNFDLIKSVANSFQTSLTSTLLKYRILGDFPLAIIYSKNKKVEWSSFAEDFHLQYVPKGTNVPTNSVAYDFFNDDKLPDEPEEIEAMSWFYQDFKVVDFHDTVFYEQCIRIGKNGVISCIWND